MAKKKLSVVLGSLAIVAAVGFAPLGASGDQTGKQTTVDQTGAQIPQKPLTLRPGTFIPGDPPIICIKPKKRGKKPSLFDRQKAEILKATNTLRRAAAPKLKAKLSELAKLIRALKNPCDPPKMKVMMGTSASCQTGGSDDDP
jgi:hypothetical protein